MKSQLFIEVGISSLADLGFGVYLEILYILLAKHQRVRNLSVIQTNGINRSLEIIGYDLHKVFGFTSSSLFYLFTARDPFSDNQSVFLFCS